MRHDFLLAPPLAVAPSPPRMREAPAATVLVALPGPAQRLAPRRTRALAPAVALTAVVRAAADEPTSLRDSEADLIERVVRESGGNVSVAAKKLRVSRGLIYRRLRNATPSPGSH